MLKLHFLAAFLFPPLLFGARLMYTQTEPGIINFGDGSVLFAYVYLRLGPGSKAIFDSTMIVTAVD